MPLPDRRPLSDVQPPLADDSPTAVSPVNDDLGARLRADQIDPVLNASNEAYPVDSGSSIYSVLSGRDRAVARTLFDGRRSFAFPIPESLL
jgi:hypothetical protein